MKRLLLTLLAASLCWLAGAQGITGDWYGTLAIGPSQLALVLHVERAGDGYVTVMDSPDQGASDIPTTSTSFDGSVYMVVADNMAMTYTATLRDGELEGTFTQGTLSLPLTFTRNREEKIRPQTPHPPYPYSAEEVTFPNEEAGITLAGTLTVPEGEGPFPAAVLITGSGPQNRDEELFQHKPFHVIADYLTRNGIAVLRYDDRGTFSSGGDYASSDMYDFASDAVSALEYMRGRPEIDSAKVGLIGHSEGGMITYIIAAQHPEAAFIVSMAGPVVKGKEFMREQRRLVTNAMGLSESVFEENERMVEAVENIIDNYPREHIAENLDSLAVTLLPAGMKDDPMALEQIKTALVQSSSPEMISLLNYDPAPWISRISVPVFAIVGDKDLQVPPSVVEPLRSGIGSEAPLTLKVYPGLNHLFQHATTGLPTEYGGIEETISPEVLEDIAVWIKETVR